MAELFQKEKNIDKNINIVHNHIDVNDKQISSKEEG